LLGPGLAGYSALEEALAVRYTAEVEHKAASLPWIGTLATGLASGCTSIPGYQIAPLRYDELYLFMYDYHLLNQLLSGKDSATAQKNAARFAHRRGLRTYIGTACLPQDNSYLRGTLQLNDFLKHHSTEQDTTCLLVGCIGIEHLADCSQLEIRSPVLPHQRLAKQEEVLQQILEMVNMHGNP
jgi:hypothetical protein